MRNEKRGLLGQENLHKGDGTTDGDTNPAACLGLGPSAIGERSGEKSVAGLAECEVGAAAGVYSGGKDGLVELGGYAKSSDGQGCGGFSVTIEGAGEGTSQSKQGGWVALDGDVGEWDGVGYGEIGCGDGAGEGDGDLAGSVPLKKEDKLISLTLPKTELLRPRFFAGDPVIVWANCFSLWGWSFPESVMIEACTITGGAIVEPFSFVISIRTFCMKNTNKVADKSKSNGQNASYHCKSLNQCLLP